MRFAKNSDDLFDGGDRMEKLADCLLQVVC
jgi:hypothetical protein